MDFIFTFIAIILFSMVLASKKLNGDARELNRLSIVLFWVKCGFSLAFYWLSLHVPAVKIFLLDSQNFFDQSYDLNRVFFQDTSDFFRLFFGSDSNGDLAHKYLSETTLWESNSALNDNRIMLRLNALIHFFSGHSYWVHIVVFNFLALIGTRGIVVGLKKYVANLSLFFGVLTFALPTLLYASGQPMKESVLLFGLGLLVLTFNTDISKVKRCVYFLLAMFILLSVKQYILLILIFVGLFYAIMRLLVKRSVWLVGGVIAAICVIIYATFPRFEHEVISYVSYKQDDMIRLSKGGIFLKKAANSKDIYVVPLSETAAIERLPQGKVRMKDTVNGYYKGSSTNMFYTEHAFYFPNQSFTIELDIPVPANSLFDATLIHNQKSVFYESLPMALVNGMFRPFWSETDGWMKRIPIVEYLFCYALLIVAFVFRRKLRAEDLQLIAAFGVFALCLFLLTGISIQVSGAIVRYRIVALVALICISFVVLKKMKWKWSEK